MLSQFPVLLEGASDFRLWAHLGGAVERGAAPLVERKRVLASLLTKVGTTTPRLLYNEHFDDGAALFAHAGALRAS